MSTPMPWWRTDEYNRTTHLPNEFNLAAGPHGVALVQAFADGRTSGGWGMQDKGSGTFMPNYTRDAFRARKALHHYEKKGQPFAIVMRSVQILCVDIDGKNGGLEHAKKLGFLPPTLAETSKSGDGYHLFYGYNQPWSETEGFAALHDRIGVEQGVDIRATGCVYHYPQQRWNTRSLAPMPTFLSDLLVTKQVERAARAAHVANVAASGDPEEIMLMHAALEADLAQPIPAGKRNNTLFAIGQQMKAAEVPNWETKILARAEEVGLNPDECEKLVNNITRYN